jgi:hypothetical protein
MLKRIITILAALFSLFNVLAQRPDWEKMPISYLQLPSMPVVPMANKYQFNVVFGNSDNYNNNNYYPQQRDVQAVSGALQLNGCQQVANSPQFKLQINIAGFSVVNQQMRTTNVTSPSGAIQYRFYFDVFYVFKISYQVFDGNGNQVRSGVINGSDSPQYKSTMSFPNQYELENWWSYPMNRNQFLLSCDNDSYQQAMFRANQQLNSELGFTIINEKLEVANLKGSEYADLQAAFGNAGMGYNYLVTDKTKAIDYLNQATQGWEGALSEFNGTDKNARINEHIAVGLYANLALAYCYAENWDKSNFYIAKLKSLEKEEYKKKVAETIAIEMDYEQRFRANVTQ